MSYQAYLDGIEDKTGLTPQQLLDIAAEKGFTATSKAGDVLAWLAEDYGVGKGYGMALFGVLKNGPTISEKHVGTDGVHRDESVHLRLDGKANR
jgi:LysM repeat protein